MARVLLTSRYSDLNDWPGRLFEADETTTVNTLSSTQFRFTYGSGGPFQDYSVSITGTGFTNNGGVPTGGKINKIEVRDGGGNLILTIDQFSGNGIARDLAQVASSIFGWEQDGDGAGPDGSLAWSQILSGNDTIIGTNGDDGRILQGVMAGNDKFLMKGGDDWIHAGAGRDMISGGAGFDTFSFERTTWNEGQSAVGGAIVNMVKKFAIDPWGFKDVFTGIEAVFGSRFNDKFIGSNAQEEEFYGLRGRDTISGGGGTDVLNYSSDVWNGGRRGVTVDLETSFKKGVASGFAIDGFGQRDTLVSIEDLNATQFGDRITGSRFSNRINGGDGNDTTTGGGGKDTFYWREQNHIGDDDVITDFAVTGTSRDELQFRTENFDNMSSTLTLVNGTDATSAGVGTFVFDGGTSTLYWDADGLGGDAKVKIVTLTGVTSLSAANFDLF
jgi:Ca2+-binding RTX toxin-like protein